MRRKFYAVFMVMAMIVQLVPMVYATPYNFYDTDNNSTNSSDNTSTYVTVTRTANSVSSVIYTGLLSGYDNGHWANFDFSNNQSVSIFDWINETCDTISVTTPPDDDDDADSDDSSEDGDTEDSPSNDIDDMLDFLIL